MKDDQTANKINQTNDSIGGKGIVTESGIKSDPPLLPTPSPIDPSARSALITAIGIILGFALTFFSTWTLKDSLLQKPAQPNLQEATQVETPRSVLGPKQIPILDGEWELEDLLALAGICAGIAFLTVSLYMSLSLNQSVGDYNKTITVLILGIAITFLSSLFAVFV